MNPIFRSIDYETAKRALLKEDLRFLEGFAGDVEEMRDALRHYVTAFQDREIAEKALYDYMTSIGDTGVAYWDHATKTVIRPILVEDQENIKKPLRAAARNCQLKVVEQRSALLRLMYGRRDEDDDEDTYGCDNDNDNDN